MSEPTERLEDLFDAATTTEGEDVEVLSTLGDTTRYRLVRLLDAAETELSVSDLDDAVGVSFSAVSHALSDLTDAGLVTARRDGTKRYYRPTDRADAILVALDETRGD